MSSSGVPDIALQGKGVLQSALVDAGSTRQQNYAQGEDPVEVRCRGIQADDLRSLHHGGGRGEHLPRP